MSTACRRYEILLPQRYNDGRSIPKRLLTQTLIELREQFGAVSCETQRIHGHWHFQGDLYKDELVRVFVDVADTTEHVAYFKDYKEKFKQRFEQLDIWLVSYSIDVL